MVFEDIILKENCNGHIFTFTLQHYTIADIQDLTKTHLGVRSSFECYLNTCMDLYDCSCLWEARGGIAGASSSLWQLIEPTTAWRALSSTSVPDRIYNEAAICLIINLRASATLIRSLFPFINHYGPAILLMGDGSADGPQLRH